MTYPRIVCFGASSTHGRNDAAGGGFVGKLKAHHEPLADENLVYNLGIPGQTTGDMLKRFAAETAARRPHLIIFYSGYNDIVRRPRPNASPQLDIEQYKSNLKTLFEGGKAIAEILIILPLPFIPEKTAPFKNSQWHYLKSDADLYITAQKEVALDLGLPVIDLYFKPSKHPLSALLSEDGLHPSSLGHDLIFESLLLWLREKKAN